MESIHLQREKVYDGVLRILHAVIGLSVVMLLASAWFSESVEEGLGEKSGWMLHIYAGYVLAGAFLARLAWAIAGPRHARFRDLWHVEAWRHPWKYLGNRASKPFGHDPLASAAYLAVYGILAVMAATGIGMAAVEHGMGPLSPWLFDRLWLKEILEEPHELLAWVVVGFAVVHIGAIIFHEGKDKTPIAQEMISGYQYRAPKANNEEPL